MKPTREHWLKIAEEHATLQTVGLNDELTKRGLLPLLDEQLAVIHQYIQWQNCMTMEMMAGHVAIGDTISEALALGKHGFEAIFGGESKP